MKRLLLAFALLVAGAAAGDTPVSTTECSDTSPSQIECTSTANVQCACAAATASTPASSLLTGLTHYWKFGESGSPWSDSVGTRTMTATGSVSSVAGISGNGISATGSANYVSNTSALTTDVSTDVRTLSAWVMVDKSAVNYTASIISVGTSQYGNIFTQSINAYAGDLIDFFWYQSDGTGISARIPGASVPTLTWFHVVAWLDVDGYVRASINGGTPVVSSTTHDGSFRAINGAGPSVRIPAGSVAGVGPIGVDEVGLWSRVLTADERATLYNAGVGKFYPSF
jgi:hypothetical protein